MKKGNANVACLDVIFGEMQPVLHFIKRSRQERVKLQHAVLSGVSNLSYDSPMSHSCKNVSTCLEVHKLDRLSQT